MFRAWTDAPGQKNPYQDQLTSVPSHVLDTLTLILNFVQRSVQRHDKDEHVTLGG